MIQLRNDFAHLLGLTLVGSACVLATLHDSNAQDITRRPLQHADYDVWNTLSRMSLSNDGEWAIYGVQNGADDGETVLHVHHVDTGREYVIDRGTDARITSDSRFLICRITPEKKRLKQLRKENKKGDDLPKPVLQILELKTGEIETIPNVRSFQLPEENGNWLACLMEKSDDSESLSEQKPQSREIYEVTEEGLRRPKKKLKLKSREQLARERGEQEAEATPTKKPAKEEDPKSNDKDTKSDKKEKSSGAPLTLINLRSGVRRSYPDVVAFAFSKLGNSLALATSVAQSEEGKEGEKGKSSEKQDENSTVVDEDGFHLITLPSMERKSLAKGIGEYKSMTFSDDGKHIAFLTNKDDYEADTPGWSVYLWSSRGSEAKPIACEGDKGMKAGWWVSPKSSQRFSEDSRRLFFDTAPIPEDVLKERAAKADGKKAKEEEQEDEKAKLDIWHWQDPQLQPQQLLQAAVERGRDYRASYVLRSRKIVQLANREIPYVNLDYRSKSDIAVANTDQKYQKMLSWEVPGFQDVYLIDLNDGQPSLVLESVKWSASLSPEGEFLYWFDKEQKAWFAKATNDPNAKIVELSKGIRHPLQDELHDTPNLASAYGTAGWLEGDSGLLIYDRFDLWQVDPTGKAKPICVTNGLGRKEEIRYRYLRLDREQRAIDPSQPIMLSAFDRQTKASGFYSLTIKPNEDDETKAIGPQRLIMLDENLGSLQKAKDSNNVLFTRSTFRMCPDLWSSTTSFQKIERVSDINPQQDEYSWGNAELVHWKADDGQPLDGILLRPDDFDPSKKYPLMVYFYERNSDNLHRYYTPAAGRSIICHSFYVSRGYLVFIPDIPYKTGEPGPSAANSILPGVRHLIAQGFVDESRIGMQGHSWGGYQTAYLVTQTDMFACAESGAPVSNMTSAYGGIRWGTGRSRMFQYEQTQSRIGDDLWAARDKYIANSPLFFADKINTPLLILHNDDDGAVPWYQGIELFVALRRLEKPAWMLNYNGNPHWVMGNANRRDFAIRMQQFFDHYLKDAPEPEWMAAGVPAVDKGENDGLELLEPVAEAEEEQAANGE